VQNDRVIFGYIWVLSKFVLQIDWLGNRRNEIFRSERWSGFPRGSYLVEIYELQIGAQIFFIVLCMCPGYRTLM